MSNTLSKISDFIIKVVMMFTTLIALVFFAGQYPQQATIFGFLGVLYIVAMITKGLSDIFIKEQE